MKISEENISEISDIDLYNYFWKLGKEQDDLAFDDPSRNIYIDAFWAIHKLEAEVLNGGFDQFFANGGYDLYSEEALFGFEKMGSSIFELLLRTAIHIHEEETDEERNTRNPKYDILDAKFYDHDEIEDENFSPINLLQLNFIKNNIELINKG